jgi:hypothetical protein
VTTSQTGELSWSGHTHAQYVSTGQTGVFALAANTGKFASLDASNYLCSTQIPNVTGDVCINAGSNVSTVYKIQGYPVSNTQPANGQTLQFNGSSWVPGDIAAGGNGGGGLVYYFNERVAADLPTGNLPTSYSGTYELGRTGVINQASFETPNLPQATYSGVVGFITDVLDPQVISIPAGLFDFNIWASSNTATQTIIKLEVYKYDGATTTASLLASSDDVYTYDGAVTAQYILSVVLPQTTISSTDRLYIRILAKALAGNKKITLYFGGNTPSHVHTTIPSVGGSGLIKVVNGIMQSSASTIVDADISASAAIAGSKIQSNYFATVNDLTGYVTFTAGNQNYVSKDQTGTFVDSSQTGSFVATGRTGVFALAANTGGFVTTGQICNGANIAISRASNTIHASAACSVLVGGALNTICSSWNASLGGYSNVINGTSTVSAGGCGNSINGSFGGIFGGQSNLLCLNSAYSTIVGGFFNFADGNNSAILGGSTNWVQSTAGNATPNSVIVGGCCLRISGWNSFVGGGFLNVVCSASTSAIVGGNSNIINGINYNGADSVILGGCGNANSGVRSAVLAAGSSTLEYNSINSAVAASSFSRVCGVNSIVAGGCGNVIQSYNCNSAIIGGFTNCITGSAVNSVILGGLNIVATGQNFVYGMNFCSCNGAFFGNGCGLTNLPTGAFITTGQTGNFASSGHTHTNFVTTGQTGIFITTGQTGSFGGSVNTGSFVTTGQTGAFALAANTGSFITTGQTGAFALAANTGSFVTTSQTGSFIINNQTGAVCLSNLCLTGGYLSVGGIEENFVTCVTGAAGLINFDVCAAATMYYINNSTANFGLNLRSNSTTTINSILEINKTLSVTFLNTNGSTAYALTGISIDGSGRSIRWLNGSGSFPAGNTGSIDSYSITAVKTGNNLYTVLGSQGKFV